MGMGSDGKFGDAPFPTGHWVFFLPRMERRDCAPRPLFEIKAKMFYDIVFRFGRPGQCSPPFGNNRSASSTQSCAT